MQVGAQVQQLFVFYEEETELDELKSLCRGKLEMYGNFSLKTP